MIVYHPAFDLYHTVFRMLSILTYFDRNNVVELDRLRIWDFYLLFPDKAHFIRLKKEENDIKKLIQAYIPKKENPYELFIDNRKMFEKIKTYQLTALKSLASYGLINKDELKNNNVTVISKDKLKDYTDKFSALSAREKNVISLMTSHFYQMSMTGQDGLKARTNLLESKYDAQ